MLQPKTEYFTPKTIEEACSLALKYKEQAKIIAGGTDLLIQMKHKEVLPKYIINIRGILGQDYIIHDRKEGLRIGALATIHSIEISPLVREKFNILAQAASKLGSAQIRKQATIAGNLVNAAPSAETAPPLIVLGAKTKITGADGERTIPIENFFTGPGQTVLKPDEILVEIQVPNLLPRSGGVYIKHAIRKAMDLAMVGVAALVTVDGDVLSDVKIALGAVAPTPVRAKKAEGILRGKKLSNDLLQKAGQNALDECSPIDDIRSSAEYRRKMIKVLVPRAIKQAVEQVTTG
jgi:carbon-monoxide dehydrogenase medium subunit